MKNEEKQSIALFFRKAKFVFSNSVRDAALRYSWVVNILVLFAVCVVGVMIVVNFLILPFRDVVLLQDTQSVQLALSDIDVVVRWMDDRQSAYGYTIQVSKDMFVVLSSKE